MNQRFAVIVPCIIGGCVGSAAADFFDDSVRGLVVTTGYYGSIQAPDEPARNFGSGANLTIDDFPGPSDLILQGGLSASGADLTADVSAGFERTTRNGDPSLTASGRSEFDIASLAGPGVVSFGGSAADGFFRIVASESAALELVLRVEADGTGDSNVEAFFGILQQPDTIVAFSHTDGVLNISESYQINPGEELLIDLRSTAGAHLDGLGDKSRFSEFDLALTVVPAPATCALLSFAAMGAGVRRRRRSP